MTASKDTLALLRATRYNIHGIYRNHTKDRLDAVPTGLNNNLIWNAGHVIATMEGLTYGLAGLEAPSGRAFIDRYRKGTRPEGPASAEDHAYIGEQLLAGIDRLETDLEALDWSGFKEYTTSFGVTLHGAGEAMTFNNMHEAMHLGTMLALRRLVG